MWHCQSYFHKKRKKQLEEFCALVEVLNFGNEEAKASAIIRASMEKKGTPIGPYDVMIAGTALGKQGILVTSNTKEVPLTNRCTEKRLNS